MDVKQRKVWNEKHKLLTEIILKPEKHLETINLFLSQHALLHSSVASETDQVTLEDELLNDLDPFAFRQYPVVNPDTNNSIAWHLWHIARIEDMTMNILVAGEQQVLFTGGWLEKMNIEYTHSGNNMCEEEIAGLSSTINLEALIAYRTAVGRQTREVVSKLSPGQFKGKVEPSRIKRLFEEDAVTQNAAWLADYWHKKTIAGLFLMPATRHIYLHLNKCIRIKERLQKKLTSR